MTVLRHPAFCADHLWTSLLVKVSLVLFILV